MYTPKLQMMTIGIRVSQLGMIKREYHSEMAHPLYHMATEKKSHFWSAGISEYALACRFFNECVWPLRVFARARPNQSFQRKSSANTHRFDIQLRRQTVDRFRHFG